MRHLNLVPKVKWPFSSHFEFGPTTSLFNTYVLSLSYYYIQDTTHQIFVRQFQFCDVSWSEFVYY